MVREITLALIASILILHVVTSLEVLANYKYWKSAGYQMIYDYSGNSRHGRLYGNYIVTDRGLVPYEFFFTDLLAYAFVPKNEYTISFWMLNHNQVSYSVIYFYHNLGHFSIACQIAAGPAYYI